jgi:phosphoenolpyruvate phosphomutase
LLGKLGAGRAARVGDDFMIVARVKALVPGRPLEDAIERAADCIDAGADAIMIDGPADTFDSTEASCERYRTLGNRRPLILLASAVPGVADSVLGAAGINMVVHADTLLRAAYPAMLAAAEEALTGKRAGSGKPDVRAHPAGVPSAAGDVQPGRGRAG